MATRKLFHQLHCLVLMTVLFHLWDKLLTLSYTLFCFTELATQSYTPRVLRQHSSQRSGMVDIFTKKLDEQLLDSADAADAQNQCGQWLKFRINMLATFINVSAGSLALFHYGGMSPGLLGLSLSRASELSGIILRLIFQLNDLNIELQSVPCISRSAETVAIFDITGHGVELGVRLSRARVGLYGPN